MAERLATLIYDGDCALCRMFAGFVSKSMGAQLSAISWQEFRESADAKQYFSDEDRSKGTADTLHLMTAEAMLRDSDVWAWMLRHQPDLKSLGWLAQKLHLEDVAATGLAKAGKFLRRRCAWCRPW